MLLALLKNAVGRKSRLQRAANLQARVRTKCLQQGAKGDGRPMRQSVRPYPSPVPMNGLLPHSALRANMLPPRCKPLRNKEGGRLSSVPYKSSPLHDATPHKNDRQNGEVLALNAAIGGRARPPRPALAPPSRPSPAPPNPLRP